MKLPRPGARTQQLLLAAALFAMVVVFLAAVHRHYPVQRWLFWLYAKYWVLCAFWAAGVASVGHVVLGKVLGRLLPIREQVILGFATGVFVFFLGMFVGGILGAYGGVFFVALPAVMIASGGPSYYRYLRRLFRHVAAVRRRAPPPTWPTYALLAFGFLGVVAVYLNVLLPDNISYDARWNHMAMAEQYAATGRIIRYPEGWWFSSFPQLASLIYCWGFQAPASALFDRVELAAHLEFTLFLWTLAAIPALVRAVVRDTRAPLAWTAMFLFPGLLLYDSSLNGGSDHVAAFWAIPIYLAFLRAWRELSPRNALLLATMLSGLLNTKYASVHAAVFPMIAIAGRAVYLTARRPALRRQTLAAAGALIAGGLILTAPHWLKNLIFYGDPVYPMLHRHLSLRPWSEEAAQRFALMQTQMWRPSKDLAGLKDSLEVLFTFSFVPHDWATMHGRVPVFGSLFTLTLVALPFLRSARLWGLYLSVHVGVFCWFWIQHEDRYLQASVPLMAAGVAAVLVRLWQMGVLVRGAVAALVGLQIVWGGDVYFFPTHSMLGTSPLKVLVDHLSAGFRKEYEARLRPYEPLPAIGKHVGRGAVLLVHEQHTQLGLGVRTIQDWPGFQGGLYYMELDSPRAVHDRLRAFGATHVLWHPTSRAIGTVADDLAFFDYVERRTEERTPFGAAFVARLPARLDEARPFGDVVAYYGCGDPYQPGLYHRKDLTVRTYEPRPASAFPQPFEPAAADRLNAQLERADFLVLNPACHPALTPPWTDHFQRIGTRPPFELWVKRTAP